MEELELLLTKGEITTQYNRQSPSQYRCSWTGEKPALLRGSITLKNPMWDLKWAAVLGGAVLGGTTVPKLPKDNS